MLLRPLLAFALLLQIILPLGAANASTGEGLSKYLCNQSVGAVELKAQIELRMLLSQLGLDIDDAPQEPASEHCQDCVLTVFAVSFTQAVNTGLVHFAAGRAFPVPEFRGFIFKTQGPPLGSRAPPTFS